MSEKCRLSVDLRKGESLSIGGGSILLTVEEKSGQRARLTFEFKEHTLVQKVAPAVSAGRARLEPHK